MSIVVISTLTWLVIIVFALAPKRFTIIELIFLYFISGILTVTIFNILDINLHWATATREVEKAIALTVCRFIEIQLIIITALSMVNSPFRTQIRWGIAVLACLLLTLNDWILTSLQLIFFVKWNLFYSFIMYVFFIVALQCIIWWFSRFYRGGIENT